MATTTNISASALSCIADALRQEEGNEAHRVYMANCAIDSARAWRRAIEQAHEGLRNLLPCLVRGIASAPEAEIAFERFQYAAKEWNDIISDIKMMADARSEHAAGLPEIRQAGIDALRAAYEVRKGRAPA
jgi:hypothetical protein